MNIKDLMIIRRNGQEVPYDRSKIITAITKANDESKEDPNRLTDKDIESIADDIES